MSKRPANPSPSTIQNLQLLQKTFWQKRHSIKTRQINGTETAHTLSRTKERQNAHSGDLDTLKSDLIHLKFSAELLLYRDAIGEDSFYVMNNKERTHVVECAYRLAIWRDTPTFVTTPGSDFSVMSGLLYELASGEADISLAGAINKFARSDLRNQIDHDENETRRENSDEHVATFEADNFLHLKEEVEGLRREEIFWQNMAADREWSDLDKAQIAMRLSDVRAQLASASQEHGPFLVWASQRSRSDVEQMRQEFEDRQAELLKMQIELGNLIRRTRRD